MAPAIFRFHFFVALSLSTAILVVIGGCAKVESDPLVWHEVEFNGTATIVEVKKDTTAGTKITFYFTHDRDPPETNTIPRLELSLFEGLPDGYKPRTGDRLQLTLAGKEQRKKSLGPPTSWGSNLRVKRLTCVAVNGGAAQATKQDIEPKPDEKAGSQNAKKCPGENDQLPQQLKSCSEP